MHGLRCNWQKVHNQNGELGHEVFPKFNVKTIAFWPDEETLFRSL